MKKKVLVSFFLCAIPLIAVLESPLAQAYYGYAKYPALGPHKLGVILVKVPEIENEHTPAYVDNLVFGEVNNFFKEASYGQFWLEGKTTSKWYDLLRGDYYKENFFGLDKDEEFVQEAIDLARSEIDTSDYDQILIIQERMTVPPAGFEGYYDPPGMSVAVIGYTNWFAIAHELAHGLGPGSGLPDLYRQKGAEINDWSLMGGFGGPLAWEKILLGWVPPSRILTVNLGETITSWVDPLEINTDNIQVIKIPMSNNHFFLVEVRQQIGSDSGVVPGVLISFASDGTGNFEMTYVPQATFSLAPVLEIEERRLNVTALDAEENNVSIRVDVYLNGRYVGETSEISYSSPYGFRVYTRGAHVLTLQETDTYGNRFGRWAPNPAGNALVVGPGFPVPFSPEPPLEMMATGYYGTPDPPKNAIFIMGYYAFQEGDRISVSDLNLTITVLEENESGSYLIRVGPELSIQQDDAGSAGDAGGRDSPLKISSGSYHGYLGVSSADYRDFYEIDAVQGQEIDVSMIPLAEGKTWIRLYDNRDYDIGAPDSGWVADGGEDYHISYTAPSTGSYYLGVFRSSGTGEYQFDVSLSKIPTALTVASPNSELKPGESGTLTATLARFDSIPLAGRPVTWSVDAGEIMPLSEVTDNQGQVSATYTASTVRPKVTIRASFEGVDNYENSAREFEVTLLTGVGPENLVSDLWLLVENVEAGTEKAVALENGDLRRVTFASTKDVDNLELRAQQAAAPPSGTISPLGKIYGYFNVLSTAAENDIENVQFEFRVDKSWISEHGIDSESITLCRYENGEWRELPTRLVGEDNSYLYYLATSASLSVFAVTGEQAFPLLLLIAVLALIIVIALVMAYWLKFRR